MEMVIKTTTYNPKYYQNKKQRQTGLCEKCGRPRYFPAEKYCSRECMAQGFMGHQRLLGRKLSLKHRKNISKALRGRKLSSQHLESLKRTHPSGQQSYHWKGGRTTWNGYIYVYDARQKNKRIGEHRLIMEEIVKRPLYAWEHVHHKNKNRSDNRLENLLLVTRQTHKNVEGKREVICPFCEKKFGIN